MFDLMITSRKTPVFNHCANTLDRESPSDDVSPCVRSMCVLFSATAEPQIQKLPSHRTHPRTHDRLIFLLFYCHSARQPAHLCYLWARPHISAHLPRAFLFTQPDTQGRTFALYTQFRRSRPAPGVRPHPAPRPPSPPPKQTATIMS